MPRETGKPRVGLDAEPGRVADTYNASDDGQRKAGERRSAAGEAWCRSWCEMVSAEEEIRA